MSKDMKLIMESWRRNVLQEQDSPRTVQELLTGLNAYILSNSTQLKKVAQAIANALAGITDAVGDVDDAAKKSIEEFSKKAIEFLKSIQESGLKDAIKQKGKDVAMNVLTTIANNEKIRKYVLSKVGEKAIKFLVDQVLPAAQTIWKVGSWILKVFKVSKDLQTAYKEGTADVNQVFQNIVKDIMTAEDNKDTTSGFMKLLNIDDDWQKILDDKIEITFIQTMIKDLKGMSGDTPIEQLNFNEKLIEFLKDNYNNRALSR